jgi:protocatechuate 3,4-dioxygenase, alpha subunit
MTSSDPRIGEERMTSAEEIASTTELRGTPRLLQTPSQTVGPFFAYALPFDGGPELVSATHPGTVRLHGTVYDGAGEPVPDALLELWQPDESGAVVQQVGSRRRASGGFTGFGRAAVEVDGSYAFLTLRPGATAPSPVGWATLTVFARGLLHHLFTRAYFVADDDPEPADALLERVPAARRQTLFARQDGPASYEFDLHLQGENETVFLDYADAPTGRRQARIG